jgi:hypothetical protein
MGFAAARPAAGMAAGGCLADFPTFGGGAVGFRLFLGGATRGAAAGFAFGRAFAGAAAGWAGAGFRTSWALAGFAGGRGFAGFSIFTTFVGFVFGWAFAAAWAFGFETGFAFGCAFGAAWAFGFGTGFAFCWAFTGLAAGWLLTSFAPFWPFAGGAAFFGGGLFLAAGLVAFFVTIARLLPEFGLHCNTDLQKLWQIMTIGFRMPAFQLTAAPGILWPMDRKEKLRRLLSGRDGAARPADAGDRCADGAAGDAVPDFGPRVARYPLDRFHGDVPLAAGVPIGENLLRLAGFDTAAVGSLARPLLLDTETTGLAGGTGTYVFLVGLAGWEADALVVRQYFLPDPRWERPFLERIAAELAAHDLVVCFNGKTYDMPLLQTRVILNGLRLPERPVLDLLHPARRYWGPLIGSCTLQNLEQAALRYRREGDLPGWMIPDLYFTYLRRRDPAPLEGVFHHNELDLVGMAALVGLLNVKLSLELADDPRALECLLRAQLQRGRVEEFRSLRNALGDVLDEAGRRHAGLGLALARLYKRAGEREAAYRLALHLSEHRAAQAPDSLEIVLIHEEHVLRDYERAAGHCECFLEMVRRWPGADDLRERLARRRRRLAGKTGRGEISD